MLDCYTENKASTELAKCKENCEKRYHTQMRQKALHRKIVADLKAQQKPKPKEPVFEFKW